MSFANRRPAPHSRTVSEALSLVDQPLFATAEPAADHFPVRPVRSGAKDASPISDAPAAASPLFSPPSKTMNDIFSKISQMQRQQQEVAGPLFAELSTEETWQELLRWLVQDKSGDFATQMIEIAAMATWALESVSDQPEPGASNDSEEAETAAWNEETPRPPIQPRFLWKQQDRF